MTRDVQIKFWSGWCDSPHCTLIHSRFFCECRASACFHKSHLSRCGLCYAATSCTRSLYRDAELLNWEGGNYSIDATSKFWILLLSVGFPFLVVTVSFAVFEPLSPLFVKLRFRIRTAEFQFFLKTSRRLMWIRSSKANGRKKGGVRHEMQLASEVIP